MPIEEDTRAGMAIALGVATIFWLAAAAAIFNNRQDVQAANSAQSVGIPEKDTEPPIDSSGIDEQASAWNSARLKYYSARDEFPTSKRDLAEKRFVYEKSTEALEKTLTDLCASKSSKGSIYCSSDMHSPTVLDGDDNFVADLPTVKLAHQLLDREDVVSGKKAPATTAAGANPK